MSLFTNLSILNKFITAFALVLLFTAGLGVFAITRISSLDTSAQGLEANIAGDLGIAGMLRSGPQMFGLAAATAVATDPTQLAQLAATEAEERKTFTANWAVYQPTMDPGRESNDGNGFAGAFSQMSSDAVQVAHDVATGNQAAASALVTGPMAALNATYNRDIADDLSRQADLAAGHTASVSTARSSSVIGVCVALGAMMVTICGLVWLLISSIGKPIGNLTQTMRRLARGEMNAAIAGADRRDEIGDMARAVQVFKDAGLEKLQLEEEARRLAAQTEAERAKTEAERELITRNQAFVTQAVGTGLERLSKGDLLFRLTTGFGAEYEGLRADFNRTMDKLQETMESIAANTQGVRSGAAEITQASDDLARRTEQQAANLEETAAALDEITVAVRKTAEGANEVRNVVNAAKSDAERSGEVVRETVGAMGGIEESSKSLSGIIPRLYIAFVA